MRLGHHAAIPALGRCLLDPEAIVREAAAAVLCRMDMDAVTEMLLALVDDPSFPPRTALTIGRANPHPALHPFIVRCLSDGSPSVRRAAVEALARQPTVDVVGTVEPLLRDPDADVRRAVVNVLGGLRSRRVRQLLTQQAETDPETLVEVVHALGKLSDTTVIPFLAAIFDREGPATKLAIVQALAEIDDPATEPFFVRQLGNPEPTVRRAVVLALAKTRSPNAARQLAPVARDAVEGVRAAVAEALGNLGDPQAHDALTRLAHDTSRAVAALARQALERIGDPT
jgi:HEAT repeat protein